jgi:DNA (cytosine-5)-methyltransferase 1
VKPLLVLYCGQGGGDVGYRRAGFDRIVGVDILWQPRYPFHRVQADAIAVLDSWDLSRFCAVAAHPPCEDHSATRKMTGVDHGTGWLLAATRERLGRCPVPWVIENVPGAPMRPDYVLCGCMFPALRSTRGMLIRPRWFESSWHGFQLRTPCHHDLEAISVCGHDVPSHQRHRGITLEDRKRVMGIDWMTRDGLADAIPPAFGEYIGRELLAVIKEAG